MPPHRSLLLRVLLAAGASASAIAACSSESSSNRVVTGELQGEAGSGGAAGSTGDAGLRGVCEPSDDDGMPYCAEHPTVPGCCRTLCYAAVANPPLPAFTCLPPANDGGVTPIDAAENVDAAAGSCLPGHDPATAALLGGECSPGPVVYVLRDGTLGEDGGVPECCYPTRTTVTGRPLLVASRARAAELRRTFAWC